MIEHYADGDLVNKDTPIGWMNAGDESLAVWGPEVPVSLTLPSRPRRSCVMFADRCLSNSRNGFSSKQRYQWLSAKMTIRAVFRSWSAVYCARLVRS